MFVLDELFIDDHEAHRAVGRWPVRRCLLFIAAASIAGWTSLALVVIALIDL